MKLRDISVFFKCILVTAPPVPDEYVDITFLK
jgi:hypothetical protein